MEKAIYATGKENGRSEGSYVGDRRIKKKTLNCGEFAR